MYRELDGKVDAFGMGGVDMYIRVDGKTIITNTTTDENIALFKVRGVHKVITSTPRYNGRSFGTNMLEAALTAYAGLGRPLTDVELNTLIDDLKIRPQVLIPQPGLLRSAIGLPTIIPTCVLRLENKASFFPPTKKRPRSKRKPKEPQIILALIGIRALKKARIKGEGL